MDDDSLEEVARQISDLEVALFLSLASREHCLIETTGQCLDDLAKELALVYTSPLAFQRLIMLNFLLMAVHLLMSHVDSFQYIQLVILHCRLY